MMAGGSGANRNRSAWRQTYRALQHGATKKRCERRQIMMEFPAGIRDFAEMFVVMQSKRHLADYDPYAEFNKSDVVRDIAETEEVIERFSGVPAKHRRAFAIHVLLESRNT